jgi:hypothetical protein
MKVGVLICGFERLSSLKKILDSDFLDSFQNVLISLDGTESSAIRSLQLEIIGKSRVANRVVLRNQEVNQGLYLAMRRAIDWAFSQLDFCVILEEDCIPSKHASRYLMSHLNSTKNIDMHLNFSRHAPRNFLNKQASECKYPFVWGWGASRSIWERSRFITSDLDRDKFHYSLDRIAPGNLAFSQFWMNMFDASFKISMVREGLSEVLLDESNGFIAWNLNSWATPYTLSYWSNNVNPKSIRPPFNMIKNVGFDALATHSKRKPKHARRLSKLFIPSAEKSLEVLKLEAHSDEWEDAHIFGIRNIRG